MTQLELETIDSDNSFGPRVPAQLRQRMSIASRDSVADHECVLCPQSLGRKPVSASGEPRRDSTHGASAAGSMDSLVDEITKKEARAVLRPR